jgi:integrase
MGRRQAGDLPAMRLHKPSGNARVRISGKDHWLGRYGSPEARIRYDELMAAYIASGRSSVAAAAPPPAPPPPPPPATGITMAELALAWMDDIERTHPEGRRSSGWQGALAAARAIGSFGTMAADSFGPRALLELRQRLIETPFHRRRREKNGKVRIEAHARSRRQVNDTIGRLRQMMRWAVARELVGPERSHALECVKNFQIGETTAPETEARGAVTPEVVEATLEQLTAEVADLVRVALWMGCRPSEVARMRMADIQDRDLKVWRYVPPKHKNTRRGKVRHIAIGPKAQAVILRHASGRPDDATVFTPRRSLSAFECKDGTIRLRQPSRRAGDSFSSAAIRVAVARAAAAAGAPHWTPYSLRYTRSQDVRKRYGREAAQAVLGHSREAMTAHYAPPSFDHAARAALHSG